jgi:hypothetical protein
MTKNELERTIMYALDELETAIEDAKAAAIKYGQGEENYPFEVGFLSSRIKGALSRLNDAGLMSNKRLFSDEGPEYDSAGFSEADRMQEEEQSHHCDDLACNCSI